MKQRSALHQVDIKIIEYFVSICERLNISYTILGGTLLGAVRSKGFIPWDDDVDFGVSRPEYDFLIEYLMSHNNDKFIFKNFRNSNIKTYFSRIECSDAIVVDESAQVRDERNAWIDIFPLDGMPNNTVVRKIHQFNLLRLRMLLQYSQFSEIVNVNLTERPAIERFLILIGKTFNPERFLNTDKLMKKIDYELKKYPYEHATYVVNFMGAYKFKEMFPKRSYADTCEYDFSGLKLRGPKNYDSILKSLYGINYMLPPSEMVKNKHFTDVKTR